MSTIENDHLRGAHHEDGATPPLEITAVTVTGDFLGTEIAVTASGYPPMSISSGSDMAGGNRDTTLTISFRDPQEPSAFMAVRVTPGFSSFGGTVSPVVKNNPGAFLTGLNRALTQFIDSNPGIAPSEGTAGYVGYSQIRKDLNRAAETVSRRRSVRPQ